VIVPNAEGISPLRAEGIPPLKAEGMSDSGDSDESPYSEGESEGDYDEEYGRVAKRPRASEFIHEEAEETDEGEDDEEEEVEEGYAELVDTNAPYELPVDEDINVSWL